MARILLVDDSRLSRAIAGNALRDAGHEVVEAVDGEQGLACLEQAAFDLVISDLLMPKCDGLSMLRQMRESANDAPVIVLSADIQESSRQKCAALGTRAFIAKPIRAEQILAQVAAALAASAEVLA